MTLRLRGQSFLRGRFDKWSVNAGMIRIPNSTVLLNHLHKKKLK